MKKGLLDFGANELQGYKIFKEKYNIDESWEVHHYEPNPALIDFISNNNDIGQFHNKAVWDKNEQVRFIVDSEITTWQGSHIDQGSKTFKERAKGEPKTITVQAIDVFEILKQYDQSDYIILKMDIETAEFQVLQRMIDTDQLKKINDIYVEFHCRMFGNKRSEYRKWQDSLVREIKKLGIKYKEHF